MVEPFVASATISSVVTASPWLRAPMRTTMTICRIRKTVAIDAPQMRVPQNFQRGVSLTPSVVVASFMRISVTFAAREPHSILLVFQRRYLAEIGLFVDLAALLEEDAHRYEIADDDD